MPSQDGKEGGAIKQAEAPSAWCLCPGQDWSAASCPIVHSMNCVFWVFLFLLRINHSGWPRPSWFIHENVPNFASSFLEDHFTPIGYGCQKSILTPQRFGKPMNRLGVGSQITSNNHGCKFQLFVRHIALEAPCAGLASTGYSLTRSGGSGQHHQWGPFWSWLPHIASWSSMQMICISSPHQTWCQACDAETVCLFVWMFFLILSYSTFLSFGFICLQ